MALILEQHYLDCLSQASYFIGDSSSGRAVVVDPRRDVSPYLDSATEHGLTIELIIETHFHADFLSGHLELAQATGAAIAYGDAAETEFESRKLADGEQLSLGKVTLEIRHTPGHTPESISIVVHETADSGPHAVLTGDTLFIGDVGRPDLMSSVGLTSEDLAAQLYDSLHGKLLTLPDETVLYPGHGAGSACGKNLSSATSSTIGEQRETNYAVAPMSREEFVAVVTEGHSAPPAYFAHDAQLNRLLRPVFDEDERSDAMSIDQVLAAQQSGAVVLDTRDPASFGAGHLHGSINVGLDGRFAEYCGAVLSPDDQIVIVANPDEEQQSRIRLGRIGFDGVIGHLAGGAPTMSEQPDAVQTVRRVELDSVADLQLVDVRQPGETEGGIIAGAITIPLTQLTARLDELDPARPTMLYCAGGFRSMIAASRMAASGFGDVADLLGGYGAWSEAHATA